MLKITFQNASRNMTIKLEGKLSGPWVDKLNRSWVEHAQTFSGRITLDLPATGDVDSKGKDLLARMLDQGVCLERSNLMTRYIVEEITRSEARAGGNGG